VLLGLSPS